MEKEQIVNYDEIMSVINTKYGNMYSIQMLQNIVNDVINTIRIDTSNYTTYKAMFDGVISLVDSLVIDKNKSNNYKQNNYEGDGNSHMFDDITALQNQQTKQINVVNYITDDNIKQFTNKMFRAFVDEIHKNYQFTGDNLRVSCRYRCSFIQYRMFYKDAKAKGLRTEDTDLFPIFFLKHIYSQEAYHNEINKSTRINDVQILFIRSEGSNVQGLIDEKRYKSLLRGILKETLLKPLFDNNPGYTITQTDIDAMSVYFIERLDR